MDAGTKTLSTSKVFEYLPRLTERASQNWRKLCRTPMSEHFGIRYWVLSSRLSIIFRKFV